MCMVTHRRLDTIGGVCAAWLKEPIDELFLVDCSKSGVDPKALPARVQLVRFHKDPGNKARHAVALLTTGDIVIQPDDDVMPSPGFTQELFDGFKAVGFKGIVGIIGRTFHGPLYRGQTRFCRAPLIKSPVRVGFCGVVYVCGRDMLAFDLRGMQSPYNDLHWEMGAFPDAVKHVVPAKKFENLPSCCDGLFQSAEATRIRQEYYAEQYAKTYAPKGRTF